jgi:hypothetical protein
LRGLVNVSGFHVDPGYKDSLKFAVYNAGSKDIVLDYGEPVFLIWYADLDKSTTDLYKPRPGARSGITSDDIMKIKGDVASPGELKKQLEDFKSEMEKRFHTIEQARQFNKGLIMLLIGVVISLFVSSVAWLVLRPMFDKKTAATTPGTFVPGPNARPEETNASPEGEQVSTRVLAGSRLHEAPARSNLVLRGGVTIDINELRRNASLADFSQRDSITRERSEDRLTRQATSVRYPIGGITSSSTSHTPVRSC